MDLSTLIAASADTTGRPPIACALSILRAAANLSQTALASAAGFSSSVVSSAEVKGKLSEDSLVGLAAALQPEIGAALVGVYVSGLDLGAIPESMVDEVRDLLGRRYDKRVGELRAKTMAAKPEEDEEREKAGLNGPVATSLGLTEPAAVDKVVKAGEDPNFLGVSESTGHVAQADPESASASQDAAGEA